MRISSPILEQNLILGFPQLDHLFRIVAEMNDPRASDRKQKLRELVEAWLRADRKLQQLFVEKPDLEDDMKRQWTLALQVDKQGKAWFVFQGKKVFGSTTQEYAVAKFVMLVANPEKQRFAGPCIHDRCGKYYVRKTRTLSPYCSRECCQKASAAQHTRLARENAKMKRLNTATQILLRWTGRSRSIPWKKFVVDRDPTITSNFLTRAVRTGNLHDPTSAQ